MRFTLTKMTTALLVIAASTNIANAQPYKGEYKDEEVAASPAPCAVPCLLKDGFYVGAQGGYDSYRIRNSLSSPPAFGPAFNFNPQASANGWVGGVMAGYGQYLNDLFYIGAEIMANYSDATSSIGASTPTLAYRNQVRVRGSWGVAALPGVRLNDGTLGYVRIGYNWANLQSHETATGLPVNTSVNKSHTSSGFNVGVGIETLVYENWSVRAEYTHTNYNSFNSAVGTSFSPSDNQFMVGVIYHFSC